MKRSALSFALFLATSGCVGRVEDATSSERKGAPALRFAATEWRPYTGASNGEHRALDLVAEIFRTKGHETRFQIVPDGALDTALEGNVFVGAAAHWWSEERAEKFVYSDAYFENRLVLVSGNGSDTSVSSFAELGRKKVAIVAGYAYGEALLEAKESDFIRAATFEEAFRAMLDGDVDHLLADRFVVARRIESVSEGVKSRLSVGERALEKRPLHLTFRKNLRNATSLVREFDEGLRASLRDGSYHRVFGVAWVLVDLDGDGREEFVGNGDSLGAMPPDPEATVHVPLARSSTHGESSESVRFVVAGETYASWDAIPERFKSPGRDSSLR